MKMCIVSISYIDLPAINALNGTKFKTRSEMIAAVKNCIDKDELTESFTLEMAQKDVLDSFCYWENLSDFAKELNGFDYENLTANYAFIALDWDSDK